jgi:hypothetical membrane protein
MQHVQRSTPNPNSLATASLVCFVCASLGLLLMHVLRSDYELATHMISDYAVGKYGWVMSTVFVAWSIGIAMLLSALLLSGRSSIPRKIGVLLLAITSVGLLVSAAYRTDLPGYPDTPEGNIHTLSFLANVLCMLIAIPLLSFDFGRDKALRSYRPVALTLALAVVLAFFIQFFTLREGMPYGLTNRLFVVALLAWLICTANRLRKSSPGHEPTRQPAA